MNSFPFRPDQKITDVFAKRKFTLSAEIIPPRNGAEQQQVLRQVGSLIEAGAEFLSVTKGAGGSLRGGSLPIAQVIKEQLGRPCVAHFTCRDLVPEEVENQLMDHHYFGIRNILALRGDPPDGQTGWMPREGGYSYAYELIRQIKNLNQGKFLVRAGGPTPATQEKTDFCIGAAVYPEHPQPDERIEFFRAKVESGAEFGITDMIFDADAYARFLDQCGKAGLQKIPVLPGSRILKSRTQAQKMMQKFRVSIPEPILKRLPEEAGPDSLALGTELFLELVDRLKSFGAPGIHLYVISDTPAGIAGLSALSARQ